MGKGKNLKNMAMKAGQLELRAAQMEHGKSYCGVDDEIVIIAYRVGRYLLSSNAL